MTFLRRTPLSKAVTVEKHCTSSADLYSSPVQAEFFRFSFRYCFTMERTSKTRLVWYLLYLWGNNVADCCRRILWWNGIWNESYELRIWNQVKLWSSQLRTQFLQLRREAWKIQDFNGVWTRDLAIPVRRSNQLSYEATDVGSWSFVGSDFISAVHMIHFIYHFIIDSFLTGPLEPTNDQLPTSVAS